MNQNARFRYLPVLVNGVSTTGLLALFFSIGACSWSQATGPSMHSQLEPEDVETVPIEFVFKLPGDRNLRIDNSFGEIQVRKGGPGSVQMTLFIQRRLGSQVSGKTEATQSADGLNLVIKPTGDPITQLLRIDAVVLVPEQPVLSLSTLNGAIDGRKLNNPRIVASSTGGNISLSSTALMHASTDHGIIRAAMMNPGWNGENRFESKSGEIQITLPLGPDLSLRARSGKQLRSEFKLDVQGKGKYFDAEFVSGNGTDAIWVESKKGRVELFSTAFDPRVYGAASITTPQSSQEY